MTDFWPVTIASSVAEARRRMVSASFDLVLVNSPLPDDVGIRFAIDTVKSYGLFREVLEAMAGCTICTHCGPDTLGLMFMNKE